MGDMADYYYDLALAEDAKMAHLEHVADSLIEEYKMGTCKWETKGGDKILIKDMTDSHLINSYKMVSKGKGFISDAWKRILGSEMIKRKLT